MHKTTAIVFPGQGAQKVGMGQSFAGHPAARDLFTQADDTLKMNLSTMMFEGALDDLARTKNTQPALLLAGIAALRVLEDEKEQYIHEIAHFVAGHSLGEYTALVAAGVLTFTDGLKLVRLRGEAMQQAVPEGAGKMAAILGLGIHVVEGIAQKAKVFVANDNADGQVVLSGLGENIEKACVLAKEAGSRHAVVLPVSAPFHCPRMAPAASVMEEAFKGVVFSAPKVCVISNITAQPEQDESHWPDLLTQQMTQTVKWRESMVYLADNGITDLLELGCGQVLTGLAKRCDGRLKSQVMQTLDDIKR